MCSLSFSICVQLYCTPVGQTKFCYSTVAQTQVNGPGFEVRDSVNNARTGGEKKSNLTLQYHDKLGTLLNNLIGINYSNRGLNISRFKHETNTSSYTSHSNDRREDREVTYFNVKTGKPRDDTVMLLGAHPASNILLRLSLHLS